MTACSQKILLLDVEKCTGCRICELACSFEKEKKFDPAKSRISVISWFKEGLSIPILCQQCDAAPCVDACPTAAIERCAETGIVKIDSERCIGCKLCMAMCPFAAISIDEFGRIVKCDLCGGSPRCVELCPTGALSYEYATKATVARRVEAAERLSELLRKYTRSG